LYDSPEGWLVLGRAGSSRAVDCVELGVNLLSGSLDHDVSGRFSEYRVRGQTYGTDLSYGETVAAVDGSATDDWVRRFRALILHAERSGTTADMRQRALWEAATRAGKSIRYTATVPGWRQNGNGPLWRPNSLAWIKDPWAGIDGELLIAEARCSLTGAGQVTQLSCCPREAYLLEPVKATNPTSGRKAAAKGVTWWSESPDEDEE
jgi:prophage tail gpP-like protein